METRIRPKKSNPLAGKEIVQIISRDGVRNLLVPNKIPNMHPEVWHASELDRLKSNAKVETVENKMKVLETKVVENRILKEQSEQRKLKLREIDNAKVVAIDEGKDSPVIDTSVNALLLDRAFLAKQEQVRIFNIQTLL